MNLYSFPDRCSHKSAFPKFFNAHEPMISNAHSLNGKFSDAFCAYQEKKKVHTKEKLFHVF